MLQNSKHRYGLIARLLHWTSAILVTSLFALGLWMLSLDYYDKWYTLGPHYHVSFGVLFAGLLIFRIIWRCCTLQPKPEPSISQIEHKAASITHLFIYILLVLIIISGYLIPTADNRGIEVFSWFTLPSLGSFIEQQEDIAGRWHLWLAYILMGLVVLHILAALKHHFIDKDNTLKKMLFFIQPKDK